MGRAGKSEVGAGEFAVRFWVTALVILLLFSSAGLWRQLRLLRDRVDVLEGVESAR